MKKMFVIYVAGHTIQFNNSIVYFFNMIDIGRAFLLLWNKFDFMIRKKNVGPETPPVERHCC